jgi:hypothetical protein
MPRRYCAQRTNARLTRLLRKISQWSWLNITTTTIIIIITTITITTTIITTITITIITEMAGCALDKLRASIVIGWAV